MKYEYKTVVFPIETHFLRQTGEIDAERFTEDLNRMGRDGWELVNSFDLNIGTGASKNIVSLFKRMIVE